MDLSMYCRSSCLQRIHTCSIRLDNHNFLNLFVQMFKFHIFAWFVTWPHGIYVYGCSVSKLIMYPLNLILEIILYMLISNCVRFEWYCVGPYELAYIKMLVMVFHLFVTFSLTKTSRNIESMEREVSCDIMCLCLRLPISQ